MMSAPVESSIENIARRPSLDRATPIVRTGDFAILDATRHTDEVGPDAVVAGLPMVRRQIRLASVSGCESAIVVIDESLAERVDAIVDDVWFDIDIAVRVVDSNRLDDIFDVLGPEIAARLEDGESTALYLRTSSAYHRNLPGTCRETAESDGGICVYDEDHRDKSIAPGHLFSFDLHGWKSLSAVAQKDAFGETGELVSLLYREAPHVVSFLRDETGWHKALVDTADLEAATDQIWQDCRKSVDGPVSRHFNRYISLFISRRIAPLNVKANHVTAVAAALGVLGGLLGLIGGYWGFLAAAFAYKLNSIIDGVDGELARGKYEFSEWGAWLDNFSDDSKDIFFYVGVSIGAYTTGYPAIEGVVGAELWLWLLGIALVGKFMSLGGYYSFLISNGIGDLRNFQFWFEEEDENAREGLVHRVMAKLKLLTKNDVMVLGAVICAAVAALPWYMLLVAIGQIAAGVNILAARVWQSMQSEDQSPLPAE